MRIALSLLGITFAVISAYFLDAGFSVQTAVATTDAPAGYEGVANLQAMHIQMADIVIATGSAIISAIFIAATAVVEAIRGAGKP